MPLSSPTKLNFSTMGQYCHHHPDPPPPQVSDLPTLENLRPMASLDQFLADPGFAERAARLSGFDARGGYGGVPRASDSNARKQKAGGDKGKGNDASVSTTFAKDLLAKLVGKAIMRDEIINCVQLLQRQVEFLSLKLATVHPQLDFNNLSNLLAIDMHHQSCGLLQSSSHFLLQASGAPVPYMSQGNNDPLGCGMGDDQAAMHPLDQVFLPTHGIAAAVSLPQRRRISGRGFLARSAKRGSDGHGAKPGDHDLFQQLRRFVADGPHENETLT
ncbi:hypothetical protein ZWY2020_006798 [Hordeum vulgare]|nr:hypothetical protein ZWY2020_006798 [Hordeum vulgare]